MCVYVCVCVCVCVCAFRIFLGMYPRATAKEYLFLLLFICPFPQTHSEKIHAWDIGAARNVGVCLYVCVCVVCVWCVCGVCVVCVHVYVYMCKASEYISWDNRDICHYCFFKNVCNYFVQKFERSYYALTNSSWYSHGWGYSTYIIPLSVKKKERKTNCCSSTSSFELTTDSLSEKKKIHAFARHQHYTKLLKL